MHGTKTAFSCGNFNPFFGMLRMHPKVSIVIPVYGVEKYIERCIESLFEQTLDSLEYIFVDDCSPDKSIEILKKMIEEYPNRKNQVKIIRNERNLGQGGARNRGVMACNGEYIIHCDPDDWVEFDMYEKMYQKATKTNADMVFCSYQINYHNGVHKNVVFKDFDTPKDFINMICANQVYASLCNKLYRQEIAKNPLVCYYGHICMNEDLICNIQMLRLCKKIYFESSPLYHYFVNMQSISKKKWKRKDFNDLLEIERLLLSILPKEEYWSAINSYRGILLSIAIRHPEIMTSTEFYHIAEKFNVSFNVVPSIRRYLVMIAQKNYTTGKILVKFYLFLKNIAVFIRYILIFRKL